MRPTLSLTLLFFVILIPNTITVAAEPTMPLRHEGRAAPDRLIVRLKKESDRTGVEKTMRQAGALLQKKLGKRQTFVIKTKSTRRDAIRKQLLRDKRVASVDLDRGWEPSFVPNDPLFKQQWALVNIQAPAAWNKTLGDALTIAILDTGIDAAHPDLQQLTAGWNTFDNSGIVTDVIGHGTWVAGTVAGTLNNAIGVSGVTRATIMPIKITDTDGYAYSSTIADGLQWATDHGARIANISFAIYEGDATITEAARDFVERGGLVFASAGNDGTVHEAANNPYIVSVGSIAASDALSNFSTRGDFVDLLAPGESIITTSPHDEYAEVSGTSFASPIAAGAAALVWSAKPSLSANEVESVLKRTSRSEGRIDVDAAIDAVAPKPEPLPPPSEEQQAPTEPVPAEPPPPESPDAPQPALSFVFPQNGSTLPHDTYTLKLSVPQTVPIQRVEYYDNGIFLGSTDVSPYSFIWRARSPSAVPSGNHKLQAKIFTLASSVTIESTVTLSNEQANEGKKPEQKQAAKKESHTEMRPDEQHEQEVPVLPEIHQPKFKLNIGADSKKEFIHLKAESKIKSKK